MSATENLLNSPRDEDPRRIAIYPGTFDPVHNGHVDVASRAAGLFDLLVVAVYDRPAKPLLFSAGERIDLFRSSLAGLGLDNVVVEGYSGLTVHYAERRGATAVVRGVRGVIDFEYEHQLTAMNRHLAPEIDTVFLMTSLELAYLSSTLVKEVAAGGAVLDGMVSSLVAEALLARLAPDQR